MIVENLFKTKIFPELKKYVEEKSIYDPLVVKTNTLVSNKFPIVPTKLLPVTNQYNNLSYGEKTYTFGIEIGIYAQETTINGKKVSKQTICDEVTNLVVEYFEKNYRVIIKTELDAENIDINVHRNKVRITGKLDTKYGLDKLVIYPN